MQWIRLSLIQCGEKDGEVERWKSLGLQKMMCMRMSERVSVCDAFVNWPEVKIKRKGEKNWKGWPCYSVGWGLVLCVVLCITTNSGSISYLLLCKTLLLRSQALSGSLLFKVFYCYIAIGLLLKEGLIKKGTSLFMLCLAPASPFFFSLAPSSLFFSPYEA